MLLWFDSRGVLKEQLNNYGFPPRAGSTNFKITAYFDGIDPVTHNVGTIKLVKPDLTGSGYPLMFMTRSDLVYDPSVESSNYFTANGGPNEDGSYPVYEFDFANFSGDQDVVILLDTKGKWNAYISLYQANTNISVCGQISFYVGYGIESEVGEEVGLDTLIANIAMRFNYLVESIDTILSVDSIPEDLSGYEIGQVFFVKGMNNFYKLTSEDTVSEIDLEYVKKYPYDTYGISSNSTLKELIDLVGNDISLVQFSSGAWYEVKISGAGPNVQVILETFESPKSYYKAFVPNEDVSTTALSSIMIDGNKHVYATQDWVTSQGYLTSYSNYYYAAGSWSGLTYTLLGQGGTSDISFTIPTGLVAINSNDLVTGGAIYTAIENAIENAGIGVNKVASNVTQYTFDRGVAYLIRLKGENAYITLNNVNYYGEFYFQHYSYQATSSFMGTEQAIPYDTLIYHVLGQKITEVVTHGTTVKDLVTSEKRYLNLTVTNGTMDVYELK